MSLHTVLDIFSNVQVHVHVHVVIKNIDNMKAHRFSLVLWSLFNQFDDDFDVALHAGQVERRDALAVRRRRLHKDHVMTAQSRKIVLLKFH